MQLEETPAGRVLEVVQGRPDCRLEDVLGQCPEMTWNQVFLEVARLSLAGRVRLKSKGVGIYLIKLEPSEGAQPTDRLAHPGWPKKARSGSKTTLTPSLGKTPVVNAKGGPVAQPKKHTVTRSALEFPLRRSDGHSRGEADSAEPSEIDLGSCPERRQGP